MIERVIIENFKSIRKLDLELRPINILIGANGAGKSNFISFFKLANQIYEQRLQTYIGNNIDRLLYHGRKKSEFLSGLIDFEGDLSFRFKVLPYQGSNTGYLSEVEYSPRSAELEGVKDRDSLPLLLRNEGMLFESKAFPETLATQGEALQLVRLIYSYLSEFRTYHFHDTGNESPIKQTGKLNDNRYLRETGKNLAAFLYYLKEKHPREFNNIESQVTSVAHFFERFDLEPDRLEDRQIELRWLERNSDASFNGYDFSDGTLRFIALTTLLLQPELPKILIIDEPELGLHPFAVNKLAAMVKQSVKLGSQVIISTQSAELIDNFEPEDIIAVDREDGPSLFRRLNSEGLGEWLEDYALGDLWNKNVIGARP